MAYYPKVGMTKLDTCFAIGGGIGPVPIGQTDKKGRHDRRINVLPED